MGFNLIYWTPICDKTFLDCSILEKCGKIWKNGRFSGRLRPDWGHTARAATAGLGSKGLTATVCSFTMDFMTMGLPHPTMNWELPALKQAWTKFEQDARLMFAGPLSDKTQPLSDKTQVSNLLLWVGEKGRDIFSTFNFAPAVPAVPAVPAADGVAAVAAVAAIAGEDQKDLDTVCHKFKEYVTPKSNIIFARYRFYNQVQAAHESVD